MENIKDKFYQTALGQTITSYDLYEFLELDQRQYARFCNREITQNAYAIAGKDFSTYVAKTTSAKGGRPTVHYELSGDFAMKICMASRSHVAEKIREAILKVLKMVDEKEMLTHTQIIILSKVKAVLSYLSNQKTITNVHAEKYVDQKAGQLRTKKKYAYFKEFHDMRNQILKFDKKTIDDRLRKYVVEHGLSARKRSKEDSLILMDKYELLRNAVWDFLSVSGSNNPLGLANLVKQMAEAENGTIHRENTDSLFDKREELPSVKQLLLKH